MCTAFESLYLICYNIASVLFIYLGLKACSVLAPQPGIEPTSPTLEGKVLTTEPLGKSPYKMLKWLCKPRLQMWYRNEWRWKCPLHWTLSARLLCLWNSPGKNTGVDCHSLLQGIFPPSRDQTRVFCITGRFFTIWATREALPLWWSRLRRVGKLGQEREIGQNPQRFYLVGNNRHLFLIIGTEHLKQLVRTRNEWRYC